LNFRKDKEININSNISKQLTKRDHERQPDENNLRIDDGGMHRVSFTTITTVHNPIHFDEFRIRVIHGG